MTNKPSVVFLFGPTAVGKTECLISLSSLNIEVVNADSMQVYRGLNIGTAKPDPLLLKAVPHHLIDIRNPDEQFHAGDFVSEANRLVFEITERGRLPVVCGGTAFYFINFLYGLPETPPTDRAVAAAVEAEILNGGRMRLFEQLRGFDPVTAARISPEDTYRLTRAIEIYRTCGKPLSSFHMNRIPRNDMAIKIVELSRPRPELYERIDRRVGKMFSDGLPEEWVNLCRKGYSADMPGMKAIGYREFFLSDDLREVKDLICRNSRRYAKRQITFFQKIPDRHCFLPEESEQIRKYIFS